MIIQIIFAAFCISGGLSVSVDFEHRSPPILVAVEHGLEGSDNILAWNNAVLENVWILCKESSHIELAEFLPNVKPLEYKESWEMVLKNFKLENEIYDTFGLIGEGSLPHPDIKNTSIKIGDAIRTSDSPTAFITRSRIDEIGGIWSTDLFVSQIWVNSDVFSIYIHNDEDILLLDVISNMMKFDRIKKVDGTRTIGSITTMSRSVQSNFQNRFRISSSEFSLYEVEDVIYIKYSQWPPLYILEEVSDENGLIITNNVNCGYLDLGINLLLSIKKNSDSKVLFVTMDQVAFDFMDEISPGCVVMYPSGYESHSIAAGAISSRNNEKSREIFSSQVTVRPLILKYILESGYSVLWTDSDEVWLTNVLESLPDINDPSSSDVKVMYDGSESNICSCFIFLRKTNLSIELMTSWHENIINNKFVMDQPALRGPLHLLIEQKNLKVDFFDTDIFPEGKKFFDHDYEENYINKYHPKAIIVHNNWIIGHENKKNRFIDYNLWNVDEKMSFPHCG